MYFVRGQMQAFDVTMRGDAGCDETIAARRGGLLLGAHLGSFEALHAAGKSFPGMRVTMVMYPDNARKIHSVLQAVAPEFKLAVIPSATCAPRWPSATRWTMAAWWACWATACWAATPRRAGVTNSVESPSWACRRLFRRPAAPGHAAAPAGHLHGRPVPRRQALRRALRDHGRFHPAARRPGRARAPDPRCLLDYVARLEALCREAPYNWFNFYDYWREEALH
jgi:predicted LPLAT superfamily acyltransferase